MAAHQALPSQGFSRQEHWSGLPFPSPVRESEVAQLCPTLSDPMDRSPPGSSAHGIFQARVLEWAAIAFSFLKSIRYLIAYPVVLSPTVFNTIGFNKYCLVKKTEESLQCYTTPSM